MQSTLKKGWKASLTRYFWNSFKVQIFDLIIHKTVYENSQELTFIDYIQ